MTLFPLPSAVALICLLGAFTGLLPAVTSIRYYGGCYGGYTTVPTYDSKYSKGFSITSKKTVGPWNDVNGHAHKDFTEVPRVKWDRAEWDTNYTFVLLENYYNAGWKFVWFVSNIPGAALTSGDGEIKQYTQLMEYQPGERDTSFVAIIYRQEKPIASGQVGSVDKFVEKFNLCGPQAYLFFTTSLL